MASTKKTPATADCVTVKEFCRLVPPKPISLSTYKRGVKQGRFPKAIHGIPLSEVRAWLDARAAAAAEEARRASEALPVAAAKGRQP